MNLTSPKIIKDLLARHGFAFTKSLGQNFLVNPHICAKIINAAGFIPAAEMRLSAADAARTGAEPLCCAFEIGAGIGVLTKELAKVCKKVVCVEIDRALEPILAETLADCPNVEIVWGDALKLDLKRLFEEKFNGEEVVCCANLPYYITSPLVMRLLEQRLPLKSVTVMVQKEAAVRLCAPPSTRDCGAVSVAVRYYSTPRLLFDVPRSSFMPVPNVDSAVIRLNRRAAGGNIPCGGNQPFVENEKAFFRIVRAAFSQRRKQLANPLSAELNLPKEKIKDALAACNLNVAARAEELTLEEFIRLYENLSD